MPLNGSRRRYWLLLEKSDETRISQGIDGYHDKTGEVYNYDTLVPNHKQLSVQDCSIIRLEDEILGIGRIENIEEEPSTKTHRRCPAPTCNGTDIRERKTKLPRFKCGTCKKEFDEPEMTTAEVTKYTATIGNFVKIHPAPEVAEIKDCAKSGNGVKSQLSILELDPSKLNKLLENIDIEKDDLSGSSNSSGQGFGLTAEERRQVELRAMTVVRELYENERWKIVDTSSTHPYDFRAERPGETRYIEVKGTTGMGHFVHLTHGEVNHAQQHEGESTLVIVANIKLHRDGENPVADKGVIAVHEHPWKISPDDLQATQYRYSCLSHHGSS